MTDKLKQRIYAAVLVIGVAALLGRAAMQYDRFAGEMPKLTHMEGNPAALENVTVEITVDGGFDEAINRLRYTIENGTLHRSLSGKGEKDKMSDKRSSAYDDWLKRGGQAVIDQLKATHGGRAVEHACGKDRAWLLWNETRETDDTEWYHLYLVRDGMEPQKLETIEDIENRIQARVLAFELLADGGLLAYYDNEKEHALVRYSPEGERVAVCQPPWPGTVQVEQATDELVLAWTMTDSGREVALYRVTDGGFALEHLWKLPYEEIGRERYFYADGKLFFLYGEMENALWLEIYDLNDALLYRGELTDWPNAEERHLLDLTVAEKGGSL